MKTQFSDAYMCRQGLQVTRTAELLQPALRLRTVPGVVRVYKDQLVIRCTGVDRPLLILGLLTSKVVTPFAKCFIPCVIILTSYHAALHMPVNVLSDVILIYLSNRFIEQPSSFFYCCHHTRNLFLCDNLQTSIIRETNIDYSGIQLHMYFDNARCLVLAWEWRWAMINKSIAACVSSHYEYIMYCPYIFSDSPKEHFEYFENLPLFHGLDFFLPTGPWCCILAVWKQHDY